MFPAPSPNSQALFAQLASGGATPSTLDFHRTAISAAAKREQTNGVQAPTSQAPQPVASQAPEVTNGAAPAPAVADSKPASGPFDTHDNDAANGLFMLAQGRNGAQNAPNQFAVTSGAASHAHPAPVVPQNMNTSPQMASVNGGSVGSTRGVSEGSIMSDESEQQRPNTRGKGKRNQSVTNGRRKADETPAKAPPSKKTKTMNGAMSVDMDQFSDDEDMKGMHDEGNGKVKMTDEEKRKNFLERNRYVTQLTSILTNY
jgi:ATF/CREB family transcription factor